MIKNIYPLFGRNRIMKKEYLWSLRDYSFGFMKAQYDEYSDGILIGCPLSVIGNQIEVGLGMAKKNDFIYLFPVRQNILYTPTETYTSLKLRLTKLPVSLDYIDYVAEPFLDEDLTLKDDELELCRFKLKKGFELRDQYKDFYDIETEFDTVNLARASWAGPHSPSLAPAITRYFAREAMKCRPEQAKDITFISVCLDRETAVPRVLIEDYVRCKLDLPDEESLDNETLFAHLDMILDNLRHGTERRPDRKMRRKRQILVE